jgi:hypothetical protein
MKLSGKERNVSMKFKDPNAVTPLDLALASVVTEPALNLTPDPLIAHIISRSTPKNFSKTKLGRYLILFYLTHPMRDLGIQASNLDYVVFNLDELLAAMVEKKYIEMSSTGHSTIFKILPDAPLNAVPEPFLSTINRLTGEWDDRGHDEMIKEVRVRVKEALKHLHD